MTHQCLAPLSNFSKTVWPIRDFTVAAFGCSLESMFFGLAIRSAIAGLLVRIFHGTFVRYPHTIPVTPLECHSTDPLKGRTNLLCLRCSSKQPSSSHIEKEVPSVRGSITLVHWVHLRR